MSDQAYRRLRRMIVEGVIPTGRLIREADLVRLLEMSRTPIREALRRLQAERFLTAFAHRGYVVVELDREDLINVYEVRSVLEGLAARLAAKAARRTDVGRMMDLLDAMEIAVEQGDDETLSLLNGEFHDTLEAASQNPYLQSMLGNIRGIFERYRPAALLQPGRREEAYREHQALARAIAERQPDVAERLANEHSRRALETRLSGEGDERAP